MELDHIKHYSSIYRIHCYYMLT